MPLYACFISTWSQLSSLYCLNSLRNLLLSVRSPVNTIGGNPASFPLVVGVVVGAVAIPPLLDAYPCPEDITGAAILVICGAGRLPCRAIKLWI